MTWTPIRIVVLLAVTAVLGTCAGCVGSCEGTGGLVDECKEGWTQGECDEWDAEEVNDADWTWSAQSCEALGYDVECADGSFVQSSSDC